jgi:hypothetical protein
MTLKDQKKNRYQNRKEYSKDFIENLANKNDFSLVGFVNPFNGKKYSTFANLKRSMAMVMGEKSMHYYSFLINKPTCDICKCYMDYDEYCVRPIRCNSCSYSEDGKMRKIWSKESRATTNKKISKKAKARAKTEEGILFYKKLGDHNSKNLKLHFQTPEGKEQIRNTAVKQSKTLKEKIKNGEFTPNITNSWAKWDAKIILSNGKTKKFRSSWEACFWFSNQHLQYEKMRIPYEIDGESKTYIADFFDAEKNIVYELKPKSHWMSQNIKLQGAIDFCIKNGIDFIWINEYNIMEYIDCSLFKNHNVEQLNMMMKGVIINEKAKD